MTTENVGFRSSTQPYTQRRLGLRRSIVKFITKGDIEDIYVPLPKDRSVEFAKVLNICFSETSKLYEQNQRLTQLRDWLLPMLMNGQVTVA